MVEEVEEGSRQPMIFHQLVVEVEEEEYCLYFPQTSSQAML